LNQLENSLWNEIKTEHREKKRPAIRAIAAKKAVAAAASHAQA
jgi:hypothetical protein